MQRAGGFRLPYFPTEGENGVQGEIRWETDLKNALTRAGSEEKPVLLVFHNPG
jgi:hypothetical protein